MLSTALLWTVALFFAFDDSDKLVFCSLQLPFSPAPFAWLGFFEAPPCKATTLRVGFWYREQQREGGGGGVGESGGDYEISSLESYAYLLMRDPQTTGGHALDMVGRPVGA